MKLRLALARFVALALLLASPLALANQANVLQPTTGSHSQTELNQDYLNPALTTLQTNFAGNSPPLNPGLWQWWVKTGVSPSVVYIWTGTVWAQIGTVDPVTGTFIAASAASGSFPSGLLKGNGTSTIAAAVAGTDYLLPSGASGALTYTPSITGGVGRTIQQTLDNRAALSVTDFGAVGDGNIANASANVAAITAIMATGRCAYLPYTSAGYNFGTLSVTVGTGQCMIGEHGTHILYSGTSAAINVTAGNAAFDIYGGWARIEDFVFDLRGAPLGSTAIRNKTSLGTVSNVRIRHVGCVGAPECIGDELDNPAPAWVTGTAYTVGTQVVNGGVLYQLASKVSGSSTVAPTGTANTGVLSDTYSWTFVRQRYWVVYEEWDDVWARTTRGRSFYIRRSRGFMYMHNIFIDEQEPGQTNPAWEALRMEDFIGLEFGRFDHVGLVGAPYSASPCVNIIGSNPGTNDGGFATVWILDRMVCESSNMDGPSFTNVGFLQATDLEILGNIGNGIQMSDVTTSQITNLFLSGAVGVSGAQASSNGLTVTGSDQINITNFISNQNTGHGFVFNNVTNSSIGNYSAANNTAFAGVFTGGSINNTVHGGAIRLNGGTFSEGTSGNNRLVNIGGYNPVGPAVITPTGTGFVYKAGDSPETVCWRTGTVTSITLGGTQIASATGVCAYVGPGETTVTNYSSAPIMSTMIH